MRNTDKSEVEIMVTVSLQEYETLKAIRQNFNSYLNKMEERYKHELEQIEKHYQYLQYKQQKGAAA